MNSNTQNPNYGATITRLSLGVILLAHGLLKVFVFTIPGTVGFLKAWGFRQSLLTLLFLVKSQVVLP